MSALARKRICLLLAAMGMVAFQALALSPARTDIDVVAPAPDAAQGQSLYGKAREAYDAGKWNRAWRFIVEAVAIDPRNTHYLKFQGYVAAKRDDHPAALRAVEAVLRLDESDAEAQEMRGNALYFIGDREQAVAAYQRALDLDYRDSDFYRNYLHTLNELRRYDELLAVYATFEQRHAADPDGLPLESDLPFYASLAYYARQDYPRTIELLNEAIALSPEFDGYYGNRASAFNALKQYSLALTDYATAVRLAPRDPSHHYNRGVTWLALKEYGKALDDFSRAHALGEDGTDLWLNLGAAYEQLGRDPQALNAYDRALKVDPDNAKARGNRATLLRQMGRVKAAARDHAQALATLPDANAAVLRYNDALARMRASDWAGALPLLQEAVRLKPDFEEAWVNLGTSQMQLGNRQAGLEVLNDVLARFPASTKAMVNRAKALDQMGDSQAARRDYLRALELEPTNADYIERLASHYARTGDRREAATYFERARRVGDSPDIFINYSAFLLNGADYRQALVVAEEGARKYPDDYRLLVNLGNAQAEGGASKQGIATYRRAIAQQPRRLDAYYNLANLYAFDLQQPARAIEWFQRALQQQTDPELDAAGQREQRVGIRLNLSTALDLAGDRAGALAVLQDAIDADPAEYRAYYNRAGMALAIGDEAAAQRDYAASVERMQAMPGKVDDDPERLENLGYALFHLGRSDEAVAKLQRLLQQHPDNHSARRNLGYVLLDLDQPAEAQRLFDLAFTAEPDEVDGWLGMLACTALSGDQGRLVQLKAQFDKRFGKRYRLDEGLPLRLHAQGYWYSTRFRQLWSGVMSSP